MAELMAVASRRVDGAELMAVWIRGARWIWVSDGAFEEIRI